MFALCLRPTIQRRRSAAMTKPPFVFKVLNRTVVLTAVILGLLAVAVVCSSRKAVFAGDTSPKAAETKPPKTVDESQYVGTETCRTCHEKQYQKFKNTKMG